MSGKAYLQEFCGGWCIFIVWHWTAIWQGSIFGCSSQCSVIKKLVNMDKNILHDPHSFLHQSGNVICRSFVVVGVSSILALDGNLAGQHCWLLQPVFSHNKIWTRISMFYLNQTHSYTSQGRHFCKSFDVVGAPSFLALNKWRWLVSIFGCFSQCSVIIKAAKYG